MSASDPSNTASEAVFLEILMSLGDSAEGDRLAHFKLRQLIGFLVPDRMPLVFQVITSVSQTHPDIANELGKQVAGLVAKRLVAAGVDGVDGLDFANSARADAPSTGAAPVDAPRKVVPNFSRKKDIPLKREIAIFEKLLGPNARPVSSDELFDAVLAVDGSAKRNQILTLLSKLSREEWFDKQGGAYSAIFPNSRIYLEALQGAAEMRREND